MSDYRKALTLLAAMAYACGFTLMLNRGDIEWATVQLILCIVTVLTVFS